MHACMQAHVHVHAHKQTGLKSILSLERWKFKLQTKTISCISPWFCIPLCLWNPLISLLHDPILQLNVVDRDSTAYCGSVNDPHMRTFDGLWVLWLPLLNRLLNVPVCLKSYLAFKVGHVIVIMTFIFQNV